MTIEGKKTAKVDGGYDGGKYIKKIYNFAINEKNSELNDSIEIFLKNYGKNIKIDNWIDLKNLTNLIFKSYTGWIIFLGFTNLS